MCMSVCAYECMCVCVYVCISGFLTSRASHACGGFLTTREITNTAVEEYVCTIYGFGNIGTVNDARVKLFNKAYAPRSESHPLKMIKDHRSLLLATMPESSLS